MNVDDLIAKARAHIAEAEPVTKHVVLGDEMVGVRYVPLAGDAWRGLTAQHLPRPGSFMDQNFGYDVDGVARSFPGVCIVRGDDVDDLVRVGPDGKPRHIWSEVFGVLDSPAIEIIAQSMWETHEYNPLQAMIAAGKALRGGRQKKRSSPVNSA